MEPVNNINSFIIGMATAYYAIMSYLMFTTKNNGSTRLKKALAWIFLYWTISNAKDLILTFPGMYSQKNLDMIIVIDGWSAITCMAFLYELTRPGWITVKNITKACIPFFIYTILYICFPTHRTIYFITAFLTLFGLYITIIGYRNSIAYMKHIRSYYSNIDDIDISWLRKVFLLAAAGLLCWLFTSISGNIFTDILYYIASVAIWQIVIHHCRKLKQVSISETDKNSSLQAGATKPAPAQEERKYSFDGMPEKLVEGEELYLQPDLTLDDLAKRLNTNRTYLSSYFSNVIRKTFYDYINELRITQKSIPLMKSCPGNTLEQIAQASGFNSLSTFRRAFKKITGDTPSIYREKNL